MSDEATGCMHGNANFWVAMAASCCFNLEYACISGNSSFFLSCIECLGSQQHRAAERGSIHAGFGADPALVKTFSTENSRAVRSYRSHPQSSAFPTFPSDWFQSRCWQTKGASEPRKDAAGGIGFLVLIVDICRR